MSKMGSSWSKTSSTTETDFPDSDCESEEDCQHSVTSDDHLTIIKFYCRNCRPCEHMREPFKEMSRRFEAITFMEADLENNKVAAKNLQIEELPTFIAFKKDQQVVDRLVTLDPDSLYQFILGLHSSDTKYTD